MTTLDQTRKERDLEGVVSVLIDDFLSETTIPEPSHYDALAWIQEHRQARLMCWLITHDPAVWNRLSDRLDASDLIQKAYYLLVEPSDLMELRARARQEIWEMVSAYDYDLEEIVRGICETRNILGCTRDFAQMVVEDQRERVADMKAALK